MALLCADADERVASVRTLVYVSCGFEALRRELPLLTEAGWSIGASEGHVLFPGSDHLETLIILRR